MTRLFSLLLLSILLPMELWADRVVIVGTPVKLQAHDGYFTFPKMYTDKMKGYHFVTYVGMRRVCYLQEQPNLAEDDKLWLVIEDNDNKVAYVCYKYSPEYFEIDY